MPQPAKNNKSFKKSPYHGLAHFTNKELHSIFTEYYNGPLKEYTQKYNELRGRIAEVNANDDMDAADKKKAKQKINAEINALKRPRGPMRLDTKNETKSERMQEYEARYITPLVMDAAGKERPLIRDTFPTTTTSKCGYGKVDEGKTPTVCTWQTRILFPYWLGQECPVTAARHTLELEDANKNDETWLDIVKDSKIQIKSDKFQITEEFLTALFAALADAAVNKKFPDISEDQFEETAKRQEALLRGQYLQWQVEDVIDREFVALLSDEATQDEIGWTPGDKQTIEGNVQRGRKPSDGDKVEQALAKQNKDETGRALLPLDEPIVYYRNRIGKDGDLWGRVFDATKASGSTKKLAVMKNPETGKLEVLNYKTFPEFLRYGSVYTGYMKYQCCISKSAGARLHAGVGEMHVRRAAKGEGQAQTSDEQINTMDDFGGQFGGDDDDEEEAPPVTPAKKSDQRTALERQLAEIDAQAMDDI